MSNTFATATIDRQADRIAQLERELAEARAQFAAAKEDAASWRRVAEGLQTQLAAAAPLFEAAHAYEASYIGSVAKGNELLSAAEAWARSPEGQAWLAARGAR